MEIGDIIQRLIEVENHCDRIKKKCYTIRNDLMVNHSSNKKKDD